MCGSKQQLARVLRRILPGVRISWQHTSSVPFSPPLHLSLRLAVLASMFRILLNPQSSTIVRALLPSLLMPLLMPPLLYHRRYNLGYLAVSTVNTSKHCDPRLADVSGNLCGRRRHMECGKPRQARRREWMRDWSEATKICQRPSSGRAHFSLHMPSSD